ncbi:MAG: transcription termination factor NusA [bacterium]
MNAEIVEAVNQLLKEKGIPKDTFQEIIEGVFLTMIKKHFGTSDNFSVIFSPERGDVEIQCVKIVKPDGEVNDPVTEIAISEALKEDPYAQVGDEIVVLVDYNKEFGRRAILAAGQHLVQKVRDIEKENLYKEFSQRKGELIVGEVHHVGRDGVRLYIDKTELFMPKSETVPTEKYKRGDSVKVLIIDVRRTTREPEIIVSRKDPLFVRRLFELEVPEIYDGIVDIKSIAREAGERTKIAVESYDNRIDPIGACVGLKGVRIQAIVKELNYEKIDIVKYYRDPESFIRQAFAPAIIIKLEFFPENKVLAVFQDNQYYQAIGKRGVNLRLVSQLTGYDIHAVKESEYRAQEETEELALEEVEGFPKGVLESLKSAGFKTAEEVLIAGRENVARLTKLSEDQIQKIWEVLGNYYEETEEEDINGGSIQER